MNFCHGHMTWDFQPNQNIMNFNSGFFGVFFFFLSFFFFFFFFAYFFKQRRYVIKISINSCVGILAIISNSEIKRVTAPFSNRELEEKIAVNEPNQHVSSFHHSRQNL